MTTVLLHGLGADRRQPLELFGEVVRAAVGADELVIAPDVRAHGAFADVGAPADFALDRLAAEVAASVRAGIVRAVQSDAAASDPITIVGISMGAAIALRLAIGGLLPIERAVFVRPSFSDESLPDNLRAFPVIGQLLADAGSGGITEFRERGVFRRIAEESPAGARAILAQFSAPDAARRAMRLVEIPRNRAFESDAELTRLADRGIRSLVVGAPRDPVHPLALAERWAGALGAPLELLPPRDAGQPAHTAAQREYVGRWLRRD
ncbi:alpha/beta hydrolase [Agromyces sp. ISL-38]|uniref:alpha/beta fold hydrolase n=1 Tax=Agromyces sp. ISL-38 TaxID=2819107 RepID=UPI001BE6382B|nr:alpha/beta hydrolase [Agromyces sp. ISL-38]MBT2499474.1 alpha/beta hydrolase [Agromyces sp. ISL-38]